ncbi:U3 small nucleolar RNA-associated protein 14 [Cryptococcus wingfieldii CBS 7118]|uniref:U3 small nucleolar RNA-associated protein 14 n=1 Tax=Cryptococcus wingfieldii CBS 7118 TaxID=1295528 RepID=A0A1E3JRF6_9TREE|nr:U3 small nucleolar RNA-associated protein 14 [Cryptococcus wingfieldii CBS 7118]ODO03468.1 U3 small nucleolar RNA-associated protein 14 [Cryptococcus wingfieldii CBS 7118]
MARQSRPFTASTESKPKKAKAVPKRKLNTANAYTYIPDLPKRHRTSAFQNSLSHEELEESRAQNKGRHNDEDNEESMQSRVKKIAMMIAGEEAQEVDSEESDIDSDAAWESDGSDEERWGDVVRAVQKGKGKKKAKDVVLKPAKPMTVNLDESDDEAPKAKSKKAATPEASDDEEEEDAEMSEGEEESDEDEEDDDSDISISDGDDDPDTLADLDSFVDQLAAADKKRKAPESEAASEQKKRRVLPVKSTQDIKEDATLKSSQKLDLSSLITSHPSLAGASALMKPAKNAGTSILKSGVLQAPLPTTQQERLDREAAYAQTKIEGQKWSTLMKRVKEAEHLSFPLQAKERGGVKSANEVLAGWKPQNEMESAVDALLKKANLTEDTLKKQEDLQMEAKDMTEEEIKERRSQLRYQRELLFRAEAKAKRVAKIKSKTFRKLARKKAAKEAGDNEVSLEDLERLDPEAALEQREKLERERALERATLRHGAKNRWAKDVGGDAGEVEDRRRAKEDMLDMKEKLMRKIQGKDEGSSSDEDSEDEDEDEEAIKAKAFDQLAQLSSDPGADATNKGLMSMKFMQKAQERRMKAVAEEERDAQRQIELFGGEKESADGSESEDEEPAMVNVDGNEGRMRFTGPVPVVNEQPSAPQPAPVAPQPVATRLRSPSPEAANPWLASSASSGPSRKRNVQVGAQLSGEAKTVKALKKAGKRREDEEDDERVDIDVEAPLAKPEPKKKGKGKAPAAAVEEEEEDREIADLLPSGVKAFQQRDLVAEAFAGDNVVEDFAAEKARQVEADAPTVEDTSLAGWGAWGGKGAKKRKTNPKFLVKTAGIEPTARKDFNNSNVIITEKKDKKASQFQLKDLPYPYTSKEQYEKSFEVPVGSEWNSRSGFQKGTLPRVVKKPGAIIEPVRRLF